MTIEEEIKKLDKHIEITFKHYEKKTIRVTCPRCKNTIIALGFWMHTFSKLSKNYL